MDVKSFNSVDTALNDIFKILGVESATKEFFDDISSNSSASRAVLYKWLVALVLGANFRRSRTLSTGLVKDYLDMVDIEIDLNTRSECGLTDSINTYVYLVLDKYEYSRLDKIKLDDKQDSRELFLAIAFLVSKDEWFQFADEFSEELVMLKDLIVEFSSKDLDLVNVSESDLQIVADLNKASNLESGVNSDSKTNKEKLLNDYMRAGKKVEDAENVLNLIEKKQQFEHLVIQMASDISSKATLLSRRKTVRSYDSELLRLIMGRGDHENDFLKSIDDITSNETDMRKQIFDLEVYKKEFSENVEDAKEWEGLVKEVTKLSNVIVQLQFKLRDLSSSIENHDLERLKYFSKITDEFKNYEKKNKLTGADAFISDRYKQPSPVEFLLISDEMLFKRHMSIMTVINKSLDNEIRRAQFWTMAYNILAQVENKNLDTLKDEPERKRNNNLLSIYSKPSDIKYNVHVLKSFLVEGIPNENFSANTPTDPSPYYISSLDFLRQVNVKFANFKAGQVSDQHGRKTTFTAFISDEIEKAKKDGLYTDAKHNQLNEILKGFFHLFEDVRLNKIRIELPLMSKWIDGTENFESIARLNGSELSESLVDSISDSKTKEYEALDRQSFAIIDNNVNGKFEAVKRKLKTTNLSNKICDIINYNYYFDMCKGHYEKTRDSEVNCSSFSKDMEKMVVDMAESGGMSSQMSRHSLGSIAKVIKNESNLFLVS